MSTKKHDYWWKINEGLKMISSLVDNQRPCQTSTAELEKKTYSVQRNYNAHY